VVAPDKLLNALALNSAALNGARAVGPAVAGVLIAWIGTSGSYFVQGAMYLVASVWTLQMHVPERAPGDKPKESILQSMKTGLVFVATERSIRAQMLLALGPFTFGMAAGSLMPLIAHDVLQGGASTQGLLLGTMGAGALLGTRRVRAVCVGGLTRASHRCTHTCRHDAAVCVRSACGVRRRRVQRERDGVRTVAGTLCVACTSSRADARNRHAGCVAVGYSQFRGRRHASRVSNQVSLCSRVFNRAHVSYQTQNQSLLQMTSPPHLRGRVMSIFLLSRGTVPFGALLGGFVVRRTPWRVRRACDARRLNR
jgi:hypothetical protein